MNAVYLHTFFAARFTMCLDHKFGLTGHGMKTIMGAVCRLHRAARIYHELVVGCLGFGYPHSGRLHACLLPKEPETCP
jgi:hypothetical protein